MKKLIISLLFSLVFFNTSYSQNIRNLNTSKEDILEFYSIYEDMDVSVEDNGNEIVIDWSTSSYNIQDKIKYIYTLNDEDKCVGIKHILPYTEYDKTILDFTKKYKRVKELSWKTSIIDYSKGKYVTVEITVEKKENHYITIMKFKS